MDSTEIDESIFLNDVKSNEVYTILLTGEEAKCLGADNSINKIHHEESVHNDHSDNVGAFKWSHEATLLLIEEYNLRQQDFTSGIMSQKKLWSLIADQLKQHEYNVTGLQCLSKFSGLKRTYNSIKESNNRHRSKPWPYFSHMDELLQPKSCTSPLMTVLLTEKKYKVHSTCSTSSLDTCFEDEPVHKKSRQMSTIEEYVKDLRNERKISEAAVERRHKENIELRHRLLHSFEKMLDILKKK
ncbi:PREDICTED: uncharacterized protein LOC108783174 [Cyphomyrmex costatus]|uniref:Myb/SANT-like DNA-binding domain-containing protein n=1 Tax=Cyphomyrmex costatus TaxID=456900 RepID=A0A151IMP2_9HYME|nr:PREDICTED: uncharacterized protein LOC108783174 [Cyphomyrmex costatus]KYN06227.1 hypothetical protein ALC62_02819 [Cyphomyrmex costatus]